MNGWQQVALGDLGELNRGKSKHRPRNDPHLYGGPYPFVQTGDVKAARGRIVSFTQTYSEAGLAQSRLWPEETILITIAANIAETAVLSFPACFPDSVVGFIADRQKSNPRFMSYVFQRLRASLQTEYEGTGSVQDNINLAILNRLKVSVPPLSEQEGIANVLGALDDKIELNRRMNETLEAMAQAIFRDWFVDFGPTRRKLAGLTSPVEIMGGLVQDPARAAKLAALFPAALGDNGLPEGWEVKTFLDLFELKRGYDLPSKSRVPGPIPIVSSSGPTGWHDTAMAQGPGIVTGRYGTIGEVFECPTDFWPLNTTLYVCDFKGHPYWFVFHVLRGLDFRKFTDKAAVPGVNRNDIHREPLTMPPTNVQVGFESLVAPLMAKCRANREENQTLAATRDLLLPKLMSGEIRLRDAEAMAEAAQ